ncbi:MAG: ATP-binding protein [Desulfobacteraceae bacterium]|nr:ATP-binding protein [Desulfobacteraceae bacterium]
MLIEFSLENFFSYKTSSTLTMVAGKGKEFPGNIFHHEPAGAARAKPVPVLKAAALYGANAGGKTNLIKAFDFMREMVLNSSKESQASEPIAVSPFLWHPESQSLPCTMEAVFVQNNTRYRYGFSVDAEKVRLEWLFAAPRGREAKYFVREGDDFDFGSRFVRTSGLEEKTRENALFLSVAAQFNHPVAREVMEWFSGLQVIWTGKRAFPVHSFEMLEKQDRSRFLEFMRLADDSIADMDLEEISLSFSDLPLNVRNKIAGEMDQAGEKSRKIKSRKLVSYHYSYDDEGKRLEPVPLDFQNESGGTQKLFELAGIILFALDHGSVLVIDELECSLHPKMTRFIIDTFHSSRSNPNNAQLIFATHDVGLFSRRFFRRDQLWMVRKNDVGSSELYSLADFQVRPDASYDKDYMLGRYGAVPMVGEPGAVFGKSGD